MATQEQGEVHPLHHLAESPTHKLLFKQSLKEEELVAAHIALKESHIDATRHETTQLYCFFLLRSSLLLLFGAAATHNRTGALCRHSWIPSLCSLAVIWAIRYKADVEGHLEKLLESEKEDALLLGKCVEELRRRGYSSTCSRR